VTPAENAYPSPSDCGGRRLRLTEAYRAERERLNALAARDDPQGEYAHPAFGEGEPGARVVLIGEAPGAEETKYGRPFVGRAGRQLDALFSRFGVSRADVYITNVVKYRPVVRSEKSLRNRTPGKPEIESSLPLLELELETIAPDFVLTLGNTPLWAVCRLCRQAPRFVGEAHGALISMALGALRFGFIPLYHPASGLYNPSLVAVMEKDAEFVGKTLGSAKRTLYDADGRMLY